MKRGLVALALAGTLALGVVACGDDEDTAANGAATEEASSEGGDVSGQIAIDGSSTVAPFAEAAAELFNEEYPDVQIYVGAVDPELNSRKFIVPGLGDAGDRQFNTAGPTEHVA